MRTEEMHLLLRVAESGSMSLAARQLHLTPAAVSASLRRIETALGARLFERSTRSLRPTEEGLVVLEGCHAVLERWSQTMEEIHGPQRSLSGTVHVSAPSDTAYQLLAPAIADLQAEHAGLQIVLHCADTLHHLHRDAIDMAVRYGSLVDSELSSRRVSDQPGILVASPGYLAKHGTPQTPEDLGQHRIITLQLASKIADTWVLGRGKQESRITLNQPLCADGHLARQWALDGHGIAMKSLFDVIEDLEQGRLVDALPGYRTAPIPIHLLFPSRRYTPLRVRAVEQVLRPLFEARERKCRSWV